MPIALLAIDDIAMLMNSDRSLTHPIDVWEDAERYWQSQDVTVQRRFRRMATNWIRLLDTRPENQHV